MGVPQCNPPKVGIPQCVPCWVCHTCTMLGMPHVYHAGYTARVPCRIYSPGTMPGIQPRYHGGYTALACGYTSLPGMVGILASLVWWVPSHPGYTAPYTPLGTPLSQHGEPGHGTRQTGCTRLTALTRGVAEQTVSDVPLTVVPLFQSRFTVGQLFLSR